MSRPSDRRPCWATVHMEALVEPGRLARVLASMKFDCYLMELPWGLGPGGWLPPYWRPAGTAAVSAWFPSRAADVRARCIAEYVERQRADVAPLNRAMRAAPVHILMDGERAIMVETHRGTWRSEDGANRGDTLLDLGMWRWACRFGQAGARIARTIGIEVPHVEASHA